MGSFFVFFFSLLIFNLRIVAIGDGWPMAHRKYLIIGTGYGVLLEYWISLWIGYPLWLLRVGGLDNHFQPCLLSPPLSLSTRIMGHQSVYLLHFVMIIGCLQGSADTRDMEDV